MRAETPALRGARRARRVLLGAFGVGLAGAAMALAAGKNTAGMLGTTGAVLVLAALVVVFAALPLGVWFSLRAMREQARAYLGGPPLRPRDPQRPAG